jgi:hypothetical protein
VTAASGSIQNNSGLRQGDEWLDRRHLAMIVDQRDDVYLSLRAECSGCRLYGFWSP